MTQESRNSRYDVVIVGGGPAVHRRADPAPGAGVRVAGDLADPAANVLAAAASGSAAASAINADLIAEDTRRAVETRRDPFSPESEARICPQVVGDRRHGLLNNN
ncbi:hypothetical protein A8924_0326 [Saccharopolyspora erythraea NRRL 2338]|uniref:Uncharacterized protein n=2 Tax=Saccharopolyspora erythraea TaxID=1836 RepID=A4FR22_SACEN|nr:hypothetical protein [Saccharopolyspora erythraea]PFG93099.1 hypothetical protein A8924_0326 [Saccharopolyspora erythraea NRRL 2338]QRK89969.1 hypothetical protein JQX30_36735 [Saccharopolyspora erythraea]CAM06497.1 hypothetical protein SACE_7341 [Saccharopolyspora erythraea NRRL 2338]